MSLSLFKYLNKGQYKLPGIGRRKANKAWAVSRNSAIVLNRGA